MPTIPMTVKTGPQTFRPAEFIAGGQLVEARASGKVGVAAAGSLKVLGVSINDGMDAASFTGAPVMVNGRPLLDATPPSVSVSVAYGGIEVPVTYAAAAAFGDKLMAASGGRVTPVTSADVDPRAIVGICTQPGGISGAGITGSMRTS